MSLRDDPELASSHEIRVHMKRALIISANDPLEHDFTLYNKSIFLGETASLVDAQNGWDSIVLDVTYQHLTLSDLVSAFLLRPELVLLYVETNQSRLAFRVAEKAKRVSPNSQVLVFGLATTFIPQYFSRQPFNAVHVGGDREFAIASYIRHLDGIIPESELAGLLLVDTDGRLRATRQGQWLNQCEWPTPKLSKLPLERYSEAQQKRANVVDCKLGLAITATKGCETRCNFCGCSEEEGVADRTRDPETLLRWYDENSAYLSDRFHLYSPNILSSPAWVARFHALYTAGEYTFKWQGVSRTNTLTEDIVRMAASAGLTKLSIGIEHISAANHKPLKSSLGELEKAATICAKHGVNLVGLLMLGYPHQTVEDIIYILGVLKEFGITNHRFTGYTPLHKLRSMSMKELDALFIEDYDRRTFYAEEMRISPNEFYEILISNGACLSFSN